MLVCVFPADKVKLFYISYVYIKSMNILSQREYDLNSAEICRLQITVVQIKQIWVDP